MLERVSERGGAVAFATQNVEEARLAADRVLVLVEGALRLRRPAGGVLARGRGDRRGRRPRARVRRLRRARGRGRVRRFALLLRKDLLLLARSRPLLAVLVVYPLVLSLLVGGVLGGQGERPRVAFVNEDSIPDVVHIGDRSFDFGRIVRSAGKQVQLVDMSRPRARAALGRRRRGRRDHRPARLRLRALVADREPERAPADQPQRLRGSHPARDAVVRLHAQQPDPDASTSAPTATSSTSS